MIIYFLTTQIFSISKINELRKEEMCAHVESDEETVLMTLCENHVKNDQWELHGTTGQLFHKKSRKCLTVRPDEENNPSRSLFLEPCEEGDIDEQNSFQHWIVDPHEGEEDDEEEEEAEPVDDVPPD